LHTPTRPHVFDPYRTKGSREALNPGFELVMSLYMVRMRSASVVRESVAVDAVERDTVEAVLI